MKKHLLTCESIFWQNGTGGALHHSDFWSLVVENVSVYRDNIKILSDRMIHLTDGTHLPCDAILCGTGWKFGLQMFDTNLQKSLGLPYPKEEEPSEAAAKWEKLALDADKQVTKRFQILANPPPHFHRKVETTPYRLYNS